MPLWCEYPSADKTPLSGIGTTTSASTGCSCASVRPIAVVVGADDFQGELPRQDAGDSGDDSASQAAAGDLHPDGVRREALADALTGA